MKRLFEIFKYGDSEFLEIFLSFFIFLESFYLYSQFKNSSYFLLSLIILLLISSYYLFTGNILHNFKIRKFSSYFCFIFLTGILVYFISVKFGNLLYYSLLLIQILGFAWVAWKNAIEARFHELKLTTLNKK